MTKFMIQTPRGERFYVMREHRRPSDPKPDAINRALAHSKKYTPQAMETLAARGAFLEVVVRSTRFAFIREDVPQMLDGTKDGFLKIFTKRFGYKHVAAVSDRRKTLPIDEAIDKFRDALGPATPVIVKAHNSREMREAREAEARARCLAGHGDGSHEVCLLKKEKHQEHQGASSSSSVLCIPIATRPQSPPGSVIRPPSFQQARAITSSLCSAFVVQPACRSRLQPLCLSL
eukprot:m51a1_g14205 hypothetical protein (232) ;mRNA; r:149015-150028